jgi:hypothetical protein
MFKLFKLKTQKTPLQDAECCGCGKMLYGEDDVPNWDELESGVTHNVQIVCSRCGKVQYSWNGFRKP